MEIRARKLPPGVFVPFPDGEADVKEDAREQLKRSVATEAPEPNEDCEASLEEGLDEKTLRSFKGVRQYVMCRAWDIHQSTNKSFSAAVDQAWSEVDSARAAQ